MASKKHRRCHFIKQKTSKANLLVGLLLVVGGVCVCVCKAKCGGGLPKVSEFQDFFITILSYLIDSLFSNEIHV